MDSKPPQICRLCLLTSDDAVNIWETFDESSIASILAKHFWFQVHENDGLTEWLCQLCWTQTKTFHEFYKKVERYHKYLLDSVEKDSADPDENVDGRDAPFEPYLNLVECETELTLQTTDSQINKEDISDCSDDQSEIEQVSDQPSVKKLKSGDDADQSYSISDKEKQNAQIRDLFTMKCEICKDVQFETLLDARRHYRNVHKTKGYLMCCGKKFWLRSEILHHIRYHSNPTARSQEEEENARIRELFTMKCEICNDVEFETLLDARRHYRKVHKTKGYVMCCGKKFWRRHIILNHILIHVNPDAFHCDRCGKSFRTKDGLKMHIDNHVPLDSREHKCSLCSSSFVKGYLLQLHVKSKHTSVTGERFPCDKCDKNFRSTESLKSHVRNVHERSLEHVCEICGRRFKQKCLLLKHTELAHSTIPLPKAQCNICGAWLKHKFTLQKHLSRMHKHENLDDPKCPICNKMYTNKAALGNHIRGVHGERRHQCVMCDKAFKCTKSLREHMAIHTGENLYNCPYCEKKFKSNANMYSHRKKAHLAEWTRDSSQNRAEANRPDQVEPTETSD